MQVHQHRVCGQGGVAGPCSGAREAGIGGDQPHGAQQNVAVQRKQMAQAWPIRQFCPVQAARWMRSGLPRQGQPQQAAGPIRGERRGRNAGHAPVQPHHQPKRHGYVDHVDRSLQQQGRPGALPAQQISENCVVGQRCRCRPDANMAINFSIPMDLGAGPEHLNRQRNQWSAQRQNDRPDQQRGQHGSQKMQP